MKKIFIVLFENVEDIEKIDEDLQAFANETDAKEYFNSLVKETKKENESIFEDWEIEEDATSFSAYPDGYYLDTHIDITLKEIKLN